VGGVLAFILLAAQAPLVVLLCVVALFLVGAHRMLARRRAESRAAGERMWPIVARALTAGGLILLVAVGVKAVQLGRVETIAHDLAAEFPFRPDVAVASPAGADLPNLYLVLLDGYPRADKLASEFGIDVSGFTRALGDRGFFVATHSRSNHTITHLTLAQMFSYGSADVAAAGPDGAQRVLWRHRINEGAFFSDIRGLGYEVIAVSPAFEHAALRQADRFIDTGQLNEFEWELLQLSGLAPVLDVVQPTLLADQHRARVLATLEGAGAVARQAAQRPRLVFTHLLSPHSPQVFGAGGEPVEVRGIQVPFDDSDEYVVLGRDEYARRLAGQLAYLNRRVLELLDTIVEADPRAVVVVFSDHGSGIREMADIGGTSDLDLRTANLLAVRSPGRPGIIDDRSTLANVLPRILRAYTGSGPADVPETIYGRTSDDHRVVFERPD
jgi:hypothetical protein